MVLPPWLWRFWITLLVCSTRGGSGQATDVEVKLTAPSWVARGGSATLRCLHQVPPQLLYKVEFLRSEAKLLQYVRERVPPFTNYTFPGGRLNMSLATENSITIENLDPSASGLYWCEVSLETPIFTAASPPHQLTVVYAQKHPPIITFGKPDAVVGGLLRANCTSAPAAPAPRLTWYIDNEKVDEESVTYFSYRVSSSTRTKGGGGYRHRKHQHRYIAPEFNYTAKYWALVSETTAAPVANHTKHTKCTLNEHSEEVAKIRERPRVPPVTPISLWVSVAELRAPAHGRLQLTCTATIPDKVGPDERYADTKKQTVTVAVNELSVKRTHSDSSLANSTSTCLPGAACGELTVSSDTADPYLLRATNTWPAREESQERDLCSSCQQVVVSANGLIAKSLAQHLKRLSLGGWIKGQIQKAVLDTARIVRRFLSLQP